MFSSSCIFLVVNVWSLTVSISAVMITWNDSRFENDSLHVVWHVKLYTPCVTHTTRQRCVVTPGAPTVSSNVSSRDPRESEHIRLTCESMDGNPAPNVTWYRNGAPLSAGVTMLPASVKFGTTSSLLDLRLSRDDHGANFTCDVRNNGGHASTTVQLSVQCTFKLSLSVSNRCGVIKRKFHYMYVDLLLICCTVRLLYSKSTTSRNSGVWT